MKNKGILGIGAVLALGALKKATGGSKNEISHKHFDNSNGCQSCANQDMSIKEMFETISDCSYNIPDMDDLRAELQGTKTPGFGSFNEKTWEDTLSELQVHLDTTEMISIENLISAIEMAEDVKTLNVIQDLFGRLSRSFPNQVRILLDMGITVITPKVGKDGELMDDRNAFNYDTAKEIAKTITVVGANIFITRYLQQISFFIDESMIPQIDQNHNNIYSDDAAWKIDWVCEQKAKFSDHKDALVALQDELRYEFNLWIEEERMLNKTTTEGEVTEKKLSPTDSLMKMSKVAWFIEMAKACGYGRNQKKLYYTYPIEKIEKIAELDYEGIFGYLDYKLLLPSNNGENVKQAFPDTYARYGKELNKLSPHWEDKLKRSKTQAGIMQNLRRQLKRNDMFEIRPGLKSPRVQYINPETGNPCSVVHFSLTQGYTHFHSFSVFTHTSKMNTISFSIPAGQPGSGGSCTVAGMNVAAPGIGVGDINFICNSCYALAGKYQMVQHILTNAPRMNWLIRVLENSKTVVTKMPIGNTKVEVEHKDPKPLGMLMSLCLESYARYGKGDKRSGMEIGVAEKGRLVYFDSKMKSKVIPSEVLGKTGRSSQYYFGLKNKTNQNKVAGYFRIHDSGDFSISSKNLIKFGYILAWKEVARCFGNVKFWAPTRIWTSGYEEVPNQQNYLRQKIGQYQGLVQLPSEKDRLSDIEFQMSKKQMTHSKTTPVLDGLVAFKKWLENDPRSELDPENPKKNKGFRNKLLKVSNDIAKNIAEREILGLSVEDFTRSYVFGENSRAFRQWKMTNDAENNGVYMSAPKDLLVMDYACKLPNKNLIIRPSGLTSVNPFTAPFFPIPMLKGKKAIVRIGGRKIVSIKNIAAGSGVNFVFTVAKGDKDFTDKAYEKLGVDLTLSDPNIPDSSKKFVKDRVRSAMFSYARRIYGLNPNAGIPRKIYTRLFDQDGNVAYQCPVYKETSDTGRKIPYKDACLESKCRFCWVCPDQSVTYGEH